MLAGNARPEIVPVDVDAATAWTRRQIVFSQRPLSDLAAEFNRYLSVPVFVDDPELGGTRVSGNFSAYDEEAFLAFLRDLNGARVEVGDRAVHVMRRGR